MVPSELEVIVLVPVLQRQVPQRRGVGELQVREMPVQDLSVTHRQIHRTGKIYLLIYFALPPPSGRWSFSWGR